MLNAAVIGFYLIASSCKVNSS